MKRAAAALATVAVLSGLRTAAAEPCPPQAELGGDDAAVTRVVEELKRLGVAVASRPNGTTSDGAVATRDGCLIVRAQVELDDSGGIAVAVRGPTRGSEGRVVSDAALAAAWIESWTREDVDVALWAAPPGTRVAAIEESAPAASATPPSATPATTAPPPADGAPSASRWERIAIAASYDLAWTDDDASWSGVGASVCVRVGGACIGGRARVMFDGARLYNSTGVSRNDAAVFATASYPLAIGTMSIAPELGVGVGRTSTSRTEGTCKAVMPPNCMDPMDPNCMLNEPMCDPSSPDGTTPGTAPKVYVGDNFNAATFTPRIEFALRIAIPLFERVWLDGLAGLTFSPFGHTSDFATDVMNPIAPSESLSLPGEPTTGYVVGVGLRWGAK